MLKYLALKKIMLIIIGLEYNYSIVTNVTGIEPGLDRWSPGGADKPHRPAG